jgi:hypothetical protein
MTGVTFRLREYLDQPVGRDAILLAAQFERVDLLGLDGIADEAVRRRAEQDLIGSSRADTFTVSPVTSLCPADGSPATTSPVLTPVRMASRTPWSRSRPSFRSASDSRIAAAARTARRASSS